MDLREKKTKRNIKNAFLRLRSQKELERITVKELSEAAEISKATFYLHYKDIYDLSDRLELEVLESVMKDLSSDQVWKNPSALTQEMLLSFHAHENLINLLFSGSRSHILPQKIEDCLRGAIYERRPDLKENASFNIALSYQIQGAYYTYVNYRSVFGNDTVLASISEITDHLKDILTV